jgi:hypothetical protein
MPSEPASVVAVGRWGILTVATFGASGDDTEVETAFVGNGVLVPGSPVTVFSNGATLWALMIDRAGFLSAASADLSSPALAWEGPASIGSPVFVPGSRASVFEHSAGVLTALAVDRSGLLSAASLQPGDLDAWQCPIGIGTNCLMPGSTVTVFGGAPGTFLALAIDRGGSLNVASLSTAGTSVWTGPESVGNSFFVPGGYLGVIARGPQ